MADLALPWGDDFYVSATGDLLLVDNNDLSQQRIIRRLLTPVKGYMFHLDYGAGVPQRIGLPAKANVIEGIVKSQIAQEQSLDPRYPPTVKVVGSTETVGLFTITVTYTAKSGQQISLTFDT